MHESDLPCLVTHQHEMVAMDNQRVHQTRVEEGPGRRQLKQEGMGKRSTGSPLASFQVTWLRGPSLARYTFC